MSSWWPCYHWLLSKENYNDTPLVKSPQDDKPYIKQMSKYTSWWCTCDSTTTIILIPHTLKFPCDDAPHLSASTRRWYTTSAHTYKRWTQRAADVQKACVMYEPIAGPFSPACLSAFFTKQAVPVNTIIANHCKWYHLLALPLLLPAQL